MVKAGGLKLFSQSVRPSVNVDIIVHVSTQAPPMDSRVKKKSFYQYCRSTQRRTGRYPGLSRTRKSLVELNGNEIAYDNQREAQYLHFIGHKYRLP